MFAYTLTDLQFLICPFSSASLYTSDPSPSCKPNILFFSQGSNEQDCSLKYKGKNVLEGYEEGPTVHKGGGRS